MSNNAENFGEGFDKTKGIYLIQDLDTREFYQTSCEDEKNNRNVFIFVKDFRKAVLFTEYQICFWGQVNDLQQATKRNLRAVTIRELVYEAIDSERDYQDEQWAGHKHEVAGYITMLGHYHNELLKAWTKNNGNAEALNVIRKIAGICTHAMEVHGAPHRTKIVQMYAHEVEC